MKEINNTEWRRRSEIKYFIEKNEVFNLVQDLKKLIKLDKHVLAPNDFYRVNSLYLENSNYDILNEKLDGLGVRSKYRIRNYETNPYNFSNSEYFSLEIKKKVGDKYLKGKSSISPQDYKKSVLQRNLNKLNIGSNVKNTFYYNMIFKNLYPSIFVTYKRIPFTKESIDLRVTIDQEIKGGRLQRNNCISNLHSLMNRDTAILEFKFGETYPYWLNYITKKYNLKRTKISKYEASIFKTTPIF